MEQKLKQPPQIVEPSMTPRGLLNYYPHCNNVLFAKLYPEAAGPNPTANIRLVPAPVEIPQVPVDADLNAHKLREFQNAPYVKYTAAVLDVWHEVMASFDDEIYSHLKTMAGASDILNIDLVTINTYINGPDFADITDKNIKHYLNILEGDWDLSKSLQQNFEIVELAWKTLSREAKDHAPSSNTLCTIMKDKMLSNPRLLKPLENFKMLEGVTDLNATFERLKDFVIRNYRNCIHDPNNARFAFDGDKDYDPTLRMFAKRPYPLGASASVTNPDEILALAANSQFKTISIEEYNELMAVKNKKGNPKTSPKVPKVGNLCFLHGWSPTHDSTQCKTMAADPKFSAAQKAFTKIPPGHNLMVDGSKCNIKCGPGVVPAP